jgi:retron-type reverse transcriptase
MLERWIKKFAKECERRVISSKYRDECISYATPLLLNGVPVIFDLEHLALLTGIKSKYLTGMIYDTEKFYRKFEIPKKSGGKREICAPQGSIKAVQSWIYKKILSKVKCHFSVYSFRNNRSIVDNAKLHVGATNLFKIDIKDFFPSISYYKVFRLFYNLGYTKKVSFYLSKLCTLCDSLPQGAPTSPYISNVVCINMDLHLYKFAKENGLKYTRYADDISFSGYIDYNQKKKILHEVKGAFYIEGFRLNDEKTSLVGQHQRMSVTGIIVNNTMSVKREYEREIRKELYYIKKFGLENHMKHVSIDRNNYLQHLIGKVEFLNQIASERKRYKEYKETIRDISTGKIFV